MKILYDIFGDIHGHFDEFKTLAQSMGYSKRKGVLLPPIGRKALFLGDLINKGPKQRKTLRTIKKMVENGVAECLMGNHEFKAIGMATEFDDGSYLRDHNEDNLRHQAEFLESHSFGSRKHRQAIRFFQTMPVYKKTDTFKAAHALALSADFKTVQEYLDQDNRLTDSAYEAFANRDEPFKSALNRVLRHKIDDKGRIIEDLCAQFDGVSKPRFLGHHNLNIEPQILTPDVVILDFRHHLAAYRCQEDGEISEKHLYSTPVFAHVA